jgi:hypothetical protein
MTASNGRSRRAKGAAGELYTLPDEGGASLRAAGWGLSPSLAGGGTWSRDGRERTDDHPTEKKHRWTAELHTVGLTQERN